MPWDTFISFSFSLFRWLESWSLWIISGCGHLTLLNPFFGWLPYDRQESSLHSPIRSHRLVKGKQRTTGIFLHTHITCQHGPKASWTPIKNCCTWQQNTSMAFKQIFGESGVIIHTSIICAGQQSILQLRFVSQHAAWDCFSQPAITISYNYCSCHWGYKD